MRYIRVPALALGSKTGFSWPPLKTDPNPTYNSNWPCLFWVKPFYRVLPGKADLGRRYREMFSGLGMRREPSISLDRLAVAAVAGPFVVSFHCRRVSAYFIT
jgi:hypothetical protein